MITAWRLSGWSLVLFAWIAATWVAGAQEAGPTNGLASREGRLMPKQGLHLPDMPVHDPWILAQPESQTYYLYSSARQRENGTNRFGTLVYKSKNLREWDGPSIVFLIPDGMWAHPSQGAWAPEVHRYHGKYYHC